MTRAQLMSGLLTLGRAWQRSARPTSIQRSFSKGQAYEPEMYELFRQILRPGMVVVDVGAHQGLFTHLAAALVGPIGSVWAFEPAPANFRVLKRRTSAFSQVTVVRAALSDRTAVGWLAIDRDDSTRHSLFTANVGDRWRSWPVRVTTLARALPTDLSRLDLIKIDAQGAEPQILRGARPVLKRYRPVIAFELWPAGWRASGHDPIAVFDSLKRIGYTPGLSVDQARRTPRIGHPGIRINRQKSLELDQRARRAPQVQGEARTACETETVRSARIA